MFLTHFLYLRQFKKVNTQKIFTYDGLYFFDNLDKSLFLANVQSSQEFNFKNYLYIRWKLSLVYLQIHIKIVIFKFFNK